MAHEKEIETAKAALAMIMTNEIGKRNQEGFQIGIEICLISNLWTKKWQTNAKKKTKKLIGKFYSETLFSLQQNIINLLSVFLYLIIVTNGYYWLTNCILNYQRFLDLVIKL